MIRELRVVRPLFVVVWLLALVFSYGALAEAPLPLPEGKVILTVDGQISRTNMPNRKVAWDLDMLEGLGTTTFRTRTPWTEGVVAFEGILIRDVLKAVGADGDTAQAFALDDYSNEIPIKDFADFDVILAYATNSEMLDMDDKGPLWIMYPFDAHPGIDVEEKSAHAVWQLACLRVK